MTASDPIRTYRYAGVHRRTGKPREGLIEAIDQAQALDQLKDRNISVTVIGEHKDFVLLERKPSLNQLGLFYKEIATLLSAETSLPDAIRSAQRSSPNTRLKKVALTMERNIRQNGMDLAEAMSHHPAVFDEVTVALLETARMSGRDIEVLETLAESYFWTAKISGDVRKATNKPLYIIGFTLIVMYMLTTRVVPQFVGLIGNMNVPVPTVTKFVMAISHVMTSLWFVVILLFLVLGLPALYRFWISSPEGQVQRDALMLRLPLVGPLIRNYILTRTSKNLADMIRAGVSKETAMSLTGRIAGNKLYELVFQSAARSVEQGHPMADILEDYPGLIPSDYAQIVRNGETNAKLDTMLVTLSSIYEKRVDETVQKFTDSIEPILTVVIGLLVGTVLFAVMMPIMTIITTLQK